MSNFTNIQEVPTDNVLPQSDNHTSVPTVSHPTLGHIWMDQALAVTMFAQSWASAFTALAWAKLPGLLLNEMLWRVLGGFVGMHFALYTRAAVIYTLKQVRIF